MLLKSFDLYIADGVTSTHPLFYFNFFFLNLGEAKTLLLSLAFSVALSCHTIVYDIDVITQDRIHRARAHLISLELHKTRVFLARKQAIGTRCNLEGCKKIIPFHPILVLKRALKIVLFCHFYACQRELCGRS